MLKIKDLTAWLPQEAVNLYLKQGIDELYPPQEEAIERGLLDGKNMLLTIPTAAGKTLLAELAMIRAGLAGDRSLYIVPLRALASEKYESFLKFRELGLKVGISTGDFDRRDERLGRNQIIVATSEKADSLMRNESSWIDDISVLVADEIHLLNSANRGPTLEMTITKLMRQNPGIQVIGLSATVANGRDLAEWLRAEHVASDWRPVALREGVILGDRMVFQEGEVPLEGGDQLTALVKDTLEQGAQILLFESSRRNAEATAVKLGKTVKSGSDDLADDILATGDSETAKKLADCVRKGSAFHHAGLLPEQRRLVEEGFRKNSVKVISSTPTLAAGLNLPARRVLIRTYKRYEAGYGMVPIPVIEYRQMAGRAGRPGLDPYGEAFLVAKNKRELEDLWDRYLMGEPEEIWSKLASESALRTHVLSTISSRFADSVDSLREFVEATFYAHQQDRWHLDSVMEEVLEFLEENGMVVGSDGLDATGLGALVSKLYVDPLSAKVIIENLGRWERPSDLTLIHLITMTPDMELFYIQRSDGWVEEFIDQHEGELNLERNYDWLLKEAKTTAMLMDWISEEKEEVISDRYHVGPGDIRRVADTAQWLMHALSELSRHLDLGATFRAEQLVERIRYGVGPEILDLLELKGIGRVRARKLYMAGYTSRERLKAADPGDIGKILGPKVAEKVLAQMGVNR